ncbi:hypothetical protein [Rummeliibacillus pycnus]|uniref:hypothetical protein n=1 Tax=Rummeliibacillus pycnus TaxID=101070 RepID=UPI0037C71187
MNKRKRLLQGILVVSVIEILCFYFIGRDYLFVNGLDDMMIYIVVGNVFFFISYFLLVERGNFRKKYILITVAYALLVIAPLVYKSHVPTFNMDDAKQIIERTEGGKVVKDRKFGGTIVDYSGQEVYIITMEKNRKLERFAFDPNTEKYYTFAN